VTINGVWVDEWIYWPLIHTTRPSLWSSGQSSWLQIQRPRVRFPVLPDFLRSIEPGTGSTQPSEDNWGANWKKSSGSGVEKPKLTAVGIRCADHATHLYPLKLVLTSPTSGGRSFGIVRWRTKAPEFLYTQLGTTSNYRATAILHRSSQHRLSLFQHALSSPAVPWPRLLTVEILELHAFRIYLHIRLVQNSTELTVKVKVTLPLTVG
jgi:hypothetical protein